MNTKYFGRMSVGVAAVLLTSVSWAQQASPAPDARPATDPKEGVILAPSQETPMRQPPSDLDVNGKSVPVKTEKLVLADPASKMYMPCRDPSESSSTDDDASKSVKLNPKASVLTEEAAKQHGYKPSPHKVVCPKQ